MEIVWRASALNDLEAIREFIANDSPRAAARVLSAIRIALIGSAGTPASDGPGGWRAPEN
jgi:plasmid stabilization system protein ParE